MNVLKIVLGAAVLATASAQSNSTGCDAMALTAASTCNSDAAVKLTSMTVPTTTDELPKYYQDLCTFYGTMFACYDACPSLAATMKSTCETNKGVAAAIPAFAAECTFNCAATTGAAMVTVSDASAVAPAVLTSIALLLAAASL